MNAPLNYVDPPDCPEGMTLKEYRRLRHPVEPPSRAPQLLAAPAPPPARRVARGLSRPRAAPVIRA